ncbi:hypothetical protein [Glaciimonas sp. PAMC28666]|uniref:hypothetical protein n=1 Tax=Glaciimonas sp. PAMC28666 TaxID=2807626 RepID=UPI0019625132|nr:hypothetical protein [Glaciimonas sp. PAMC28666]QRX82720.1 hypothetical protein JQN73_22160 [Glaciimonas sp. PAMC28666]
MAFVLRQQKFKHPQRHLQNIQRDFVMLLQNQCELCAQILVMAGKCRSTGTHPEC